jgi:hypothetical protein
MRAPPFLLSLLITAAAAPAADRPVKKWNPGHYAQFAFGTGPAGLNKVLAVPEILGGLIQYDWRDLETAEGVYDFSRIEHDLAIVKYHGKRMVILINDKIFKARLSASGHGVPDYLLYHPVYEGGEHPTDTVGMTAKRWVPAVMDRIIALHRALGRRFDEDPDVEGVCTEESALSIWPYPPGMSDRVYVDQLKRLATALSEAYPRTLATMWLNWNTRPHTEELLDHLESQGIGIGGPDTSPLHRTELVPDYFTRYAGRMPVLMGVQPSFLAWSERPIRDGKLTLDQVFHFLVDDEVGIHATHAFWWYFESGDYTFWDTVELIRKYDGKINRDLPSCLAVPPEEP